MGRALMFRRVAGPQKDKYSTRRMKIKETMGLNLREVSDIGRKTMLQR